VPPIVCSISYTGQQRRLFVQRNREPITRKITVPLPDQPAKIELRLGRNGGAHGAQQHRFAAPILRLSKFAARDRGAYRPALGMREIDIVPTIADK
jgi:hypothetical protein